MSNEENYDIARRKAKVRHFLNRYCMVFGLSEDKKDLLYNVILSLTSYYGYDARIPFFNTNEPKRKIFDHWLLKPEQDGYKIEDLIMGKMFFNLQRLTILPGTLKPDLSIEKVVWGYNPQLREININSALVEERAKKASQLVTSNLPDDMTPIERQNVGKNVYENMIGGEYFSEIIRAIQTNFKDGEININDPLSAQYLNLVNNIVANKRDSFYSYINLERLNVTSTKDYHPLEALENRVYNQLFTQALREAELIFVRRPPLQINHVLLSESKDNSKVIRHIYNLNTDNWHLANYGLMLTCIIGRKETFSLLHLNEQSGFNAVNKYLSDVMAQKNVLMSIVGEMLLICKKAVEVYNSSDTLERQRLVEREVQLGEMLIELYKARIDLQLNNGVVTSDYQERIRYEISLFKNAVVNSDKIDNKQTLDEMLKKYCSQNVK